MTPVCFERGVPPKGATASSASASVATSESAQHAARTKRIDRAEPTTGLAGSVTNDWGSGAGSRLRRAEDARCTTLVLRGLLAIAVRRDDDAVALRQLASRHD